MIPTAFFSFQGPSRGTAHATHAGNVFSIITLNVFFTDFENGWENTDCAVRPAIFLTSNSGTIRKHIG